MSDLELPRIPVPVESREKVRRRARGRTRVVGGLLAGILAIMGARGVQLAVAPAERTVRAASVQRWDQVKLPSRRGEILDRNGRRLATSVATPNIVVDPLRVDKSEVDSLSRQVAAILDLDPAEVAEKMRRSSRYARLASRVHPAVAAQIEQLGHSSLWAERSARRFYPEESLASQILGFVDGAGNGRSGLERSLDDYLRGSSVLLQRRRDRRGLSVDQMSFRDDNLGMNVHTTLDRSVQRIAERALEGIVENSAPLAASIVVVDVKSGDILAMANAPTFNPNALSNDPAPRRNHAVQDAIEPGSVLKPFTVAAAVEEGHVSGASMIDCEGGGYNIGRVRIHDDHPHNIVTVSEVIKYSSNIGSAKLAMKVGAKRFLGYLNDFGFGERSGIQLPGERAGRLRNPERIKPIELATTSFGQGMTSTPLQMAMATATLANGGVRMRPRLVSRIEDAWGVPEFVQHPSPVQRVVSEATAADVTQMMVTVTEPGGTATRAQVPGFRVAGKTGTAQKVTNGRYGSARIGSFMGFVPADDPAIAIVVTVDEPTQGSRYGGIVAAPAFAQVAEATLRHMGVQPTHPDPEDTGDAMVDAELDAESDDGMVLTWVGDRWSVPDLTGRPMREVLVGLEGSGINVQLHGSGRVVRQEPAAGGRLAPGEPLRLVLQ